MGNSKGRKLEKRKERGGEREGVGNEKMVGYMTHKGMVKGVRVALRNVNCVSHQMRVAEKHCPKENTNKLKETS